MGTNVTPALPDGFQLESSLPPLPDGFQEQSGPDLTQTDSVHNPSLKAMFNSVEKLNDFASTGIVKTATGKGFQDREMAATAQNIPPNTARPFDANVTAARNPVNQAARIGLQTVAGIQGQQADMLTSPISLIASGVKPVANMAKSAAESIPIVKNKIAEMALSPEFAQSKADFTYGHDARRVLKSMPDVVGHDVNSTSAAIKNKLSETGKAISDTIANHPNASTELNISKDVEGPIDSKIAELNSHPHDNATAIQKLKNLKRDIFNKYDANGENPQIIDMSKMTPQEVFEFRKAKIDPQVNYTGLTKDQADANEVLQQVRRNIKNKMNETIPDLKPLNQDYGDLNSASDAIDRMAFKTQKEGLPSLKWHNIATLGIDKFLANPINRVKFAQFLYTAPKAEIAQATEIVPNMAEAIDAHYGAGDVEIMDKKLGLPAPASKIGINRALPSPKTAGQSSGPTIPLKDYTQGEKDPNGFLGEAKKNIGKGLAAGVGAAALISGAGNANAMEMLHKDVDMNKIYKIESSNNPKAYNSKTKATGLGQITPIVVKDWNNMNPKNKYNLLQMKKPDLNKKVSSWYMNKRIPQLLKSFKLEDNTKNRLIAYNAGIDYIKKNKPLKQETIDYIKKYGP